ncbi:MAG: (Fe-S)-binding protein [Candidatus Bipolaricaulota bacterium]
MSYIFAPGCALLLYKPKLAEAAHEFLVSQYGYMEQLLTCCRHTLLAPSGTCVINVCPGCDRRYRENYERSSTISLWELLAESDAFPFPDYQSQKMAIIDACPTRDQDRIHAAVRSIAKRMNIEIVEPSRTRRSSTCCGDSLYEQVETPKVVLQMQARASEMPAEDVLVYCVSCSNSVLNGGKRPRYLVDLLFGEDTVPKTHHPDAWHEELDAFIQTHMEYETVK